MASLIQHHRWHSLQARHLRASCPGSRTLCGQQQQRRRHRRPDRGPTVCAAGDLPDPLDEPVGAGQLSGTVFSQQYGDVSSPVTFPCTVPLLPFPVEEVLLPGSVKALHLFEARYLALLDAVLASGGANKLFGFVVVEQPGDPFGETAATFPGAYSGDEYVLTMATLVRVVEVKRSFVGALVRIQAEARVAVTGVTQSTPYLVGEVTPVMDTPLQDPRLVQQQLDQLDQTMRDLQNLTQRFKTRQTAALQQALYWAARPHLVRAAAPEIPAVLQELQREQQQKQQQQSIQPDEPYSSTSIQEGGADSITGSSSSSGAVEDSSEQNSLAERAARLSFAALQGVPKESAKDQLKLLRCCVNAMKTRDTSQRLSAVQAQMSHSLSSLAAKCALASLNLGVSSDQ